MALSLTIGPAIIGPQVDVLPHIWDFRTIVVEDSVQVASDTMSFTIMIYNSEITEPLAGNEVIFMDGSTKEFAGNIISVTREFSPESLGILYHCTCRDYVWQLNRRMVNNPYTLSRCNDVLNLSESTLTAGLVFRCILQDLTNDASGDSYYQSFNSDISNIISGGSDPEVQDLAFNRIAPSQAFDTIAQGTGLIWWVDFDKKVHLKLETTDVSPLVGNILNVDTDLTTYYDLTDEENIESTHTQLILAGVNNRSSVTTTLEFLGSVGTKHGTQDNKIFILDPIPFSLADVTIVTKDTGGGDVVQVRKAEDIDGSITGGEGASDEVFVKVAERTNYVRCANANPVADSDIIKITYFFSFIDDDEGLASNAFINIMAARTGGDGIRQFVFAQTSGLKITNAAQLNDVRDILIERKARILIRGQFKSWIKGWAAGQSFTRSWTQLSLSDTVFVVSVEKRILTPADDPNLGENVIESLITFSNLPTGVNL